jgi:hypothetical protein
MGTPGLTGEDQDRLIKKLSDATFRRELGDQAPAAAEPRRGMHPLVARGLQIDPDTALQGSMCDRPPHGSESR